MAKFKKNHFVIYKEDFAIIKEIFKNFFFSEVAYKSYISRTNETITVFEEDLKLYEFSD
jgi:predicted DNA-binding protein YlxM (UPF0122 family)